MPASHTARPRHAFRAAQSTALAATVLLASLGLTLTSPAGAAELDAILITREPVVVEEYAGVDNHSMAGRTATPRPTVPRDIPIVKVLDKPSPVMQ